MLNLQLINEILNEKTPCDNCKHFNQCKQLELACTEFAVYAETGFIRDTQNKLPNTFVFKRMFNVNSEQPVQNLVSAWRKFNREKAKGKYERETD